MSEQALRVIANPGVIVVNSEVIAVIQEVAARDSHSRADPAGCAKVAGVEAEEVKRKFHRDVTRILFHWDVTRILARWGRRPPVDPPL
eukprot:1195861-Prorocentrum_minimum.AAC.6